MRIRLRLDGTEGRRWHVTLAERLARLPGIAVSVDARPLDPTLPSGLDALFQLEAVLHGLGGLGPAERVSATDFAPYVDGSTETPDLVIDLVGDAAGNADRVWQLTFAGEMGSDGFGDGALLGPLLDGQTPVARLTEDGRTIAIGRLGTDYGGILLSSFVEMLSRTITMIVAAVDGKGNASLPELPYALPRASRPLSNGRLPAIAARKIAARIVHRIYRLCYRTPHWRVGWRACGAQDSYDLMAHPPSGWADLADDGTRFYADPFPIAHQGRVTLFVEDYLHRLGKGIISAVAFDTSGPVGRPQPVLELGCHLSYPFVFEREGQMWMIPESCGNGTVELFRATAFPGGWVKEATLLSDVVASDATLVEHGGRWWMFATVRDGGGAFSDALHLWSADDFRGPWLAHPKNPVLIDIASARPAGRIVRRGGALFRPVQDCRRGYGAALGIARIAKLDETGYEQSVETILTPGRLWSGRRLHTLNAAGGFEFIDGSGYAPRWRRQPQKLGQDRASSPA